MANQRCVAGARAAGSRCAAARAAAPAAAPCGAPRHRPRQPRRCGQLSRATTTTATASTVTQATAVATAVPPVCVLPTPAEAHFEEGNTVFVEEFRIRGNEAGPDQKANIITIANLLQEIGGNHGVAMWGRSSSGFAAMPGMDHLIFVATRMQIRMEAYPSWGDLVRLETYFAEDGRLATRRDWRITNAITGQFLGAATSTWVTINADTRKLAKIPDAVKQKFLRLAPSPPRSAIPTGDTRRKLPDFVWPPQLTAPSQLGRRSDMDPNGHINNVAYLAWALEVIPDHVYQGYQLNEVEMDFKAECTAGDQIECFGMPLTDCANGNGAAQQFLHLLRKGGTDTEVWRARTTWAPVPASSSSSSGAGGILAGLPVNGSSRSAASLNGSSRSSSSSSLNGHSAPPRPQGTAQCAVADCPQTDCSNAPAQAAVQPAAAAAEPAAKPAAAGEGADSDAPARTSRLQKLWAWLLRN